MTVVQVANYRNGEIVVSVEYDDATLEVQAIHYDNNSPHFDLEVDVERIGSPTLKRTARKGQRNRSIDVSTQGLKMVAVDPTSNEAEERYVVPFKISTRRST